MSIEVEGTGFSAERLSRVSDFIQNQIDKNMYFGAEIMISRKGKVALHKTMGWRDREKGIKLEQGAVYTPFSVSKAFTTILSLMWIERGLFTLNTKASEIIPEFKGGFRENITAFHLLTHQSGLPMTFTPIPGMNIDNLDEMIAAICDKIHCEYMPGEKASYSPLCNHALLGEMVRRTDPKGRRFRDIMNEELLQPLKLDSTSVGLRADLRARKIVPVWVYDKTPLAHKSSNVPGTDGAFEDENAEMPWVGMSTSVPDLHRIAMMLRNEGQLDGANILSPVTVRQMRKNYTGDKLNELHGKNAVARGWEPINCYAGLGLFTKGTKVHWQQLGTLTSENTFGQHGQGSALFWVDPENDVTFTFLSHGVVLEKLNIERFQTLADMTITSIIER